MYLTDTHLLDLPDDIVLTILKKLDKMFALYSLIDIGIERLDLLAQDITFTDTLNFLSTETDNICSLNDSIIDRFCSDILPRIQCTVQYLIFESIITERILLAINCPNLTKLKIFNANQDIALHYFTNESHFRHIFKQKITDLTVINHHTNAHISTVDYTKNVYVHIFNFFTNLKHLSIVKSSSENDLPNLKCFSLRIGSLNDGYDTLIVPLLRRMRNREELTLDLRIDDQTRFVDGTQVHNKILIHMAQLHKFIFYIKTTIQKNNSIPRLSNDDIQRTFNNIGYEQVGCIVDNRGI
ncbi:unnamed protein product [Rotaria socialis]|uniref:F-box domain-containing protein n=1 Tax=Rotaria socialis TaxID=392032 RepID=A0A820UZ94_9BILA|nr:unnamed protein product [Rotaria socialis]CAF4492755.1 unnamed protein product [Rotaria socialis]